MVFQLIIINNNILLFLEEQYCVNYLLAIVKVLKLK